MSNGVKIALGCVTFFIIGILAVVGTIGFFTYKTFQMGQSIVVEAERSEALNQKYSFSAPTSGQPLTDAAEFDEFMTVRSNLLDTLQDNNFVKLLAASDDPKAMEEFGMGDAFGAIGDMGRMMKTVNDELDKNKMAPAQYDYYSERLANLIYQGAKEGDPVLRKLWDDMEDVASITGPDKIDWTKQSQNANPNNFTWGLAEQLGVDKTEALDAQGLQSLGPYRQELSKQATLLFFESTLMSANNSGYAGQDYSQWEENDQFENSNSDEDFQQLLEGIEEQANQ